MRFQISECEPYRFPSIIWFRMSVTPEPVALCRPSLERCLFDLHAVVALRKVSTLLSSSDATEMGGGWYICFDVPAVGEVENKIHLFHRYRGGKYKSTNILFTDAVVEISTMRLSDEEVICEKRFPWVDTGLSSQTFSYPFWDKIWLNNPDVRRDDGFRLEINIKSAPTLRPTVKLPPLILRAISQICKGQVIDIKFFAFSRHLRRDYGTGAQNPLPIYSVSTLLENSSDYFTTSKLTITFLKN